MLRGHSAANRGYSRKRGVPARSLRGDSRLRTDSGPSRPAGLLRVYMPLGKPAALPLLVYPPLGGADLADLVADEAVADIEVAVGGSRHIARSRAARVRPVRALVDLLDGAQEVQKSVALAVPDPPLALLSTIDHLFQEAPERFRIRLAAPVGRAQHRGEPDAVEAEVEQAIEGLPELEIAQ